MSFPAWLMGKEINRGVRYGRDSSVGIPPPPPDPPPPYETAEIMDAKGGLIVSGPVEWSVFEYALHSWIDYDSLPETVATRADLVAPGGRYTVWEGAEPIAGSGCCFLTCPGEVTARALEFIRRG